MSDIRCACFRPSVLSPMFKCDKHKEKPEEPKQLNDTTVVESEQKPCHCHLSTKGLLAHSHTSQCKTTCEHCEKQVNHSDRCLGCLYDNKDEQKTCEHGVKYLTSYTSNNMYTTCKQCLQQEEWTPSLNTWEDFDKWLHTSSSLGAVLSKNQINEFKDYLTLAIQKEREEKQHLEDQIDKLAKFIVFEVPGEPSQEQNAVDTAIRLLKANLISNKGVEE